MSKEAVRLFIEKVEQDETLQDIVRSAFEDQDESMNLVDLGREHGFEFTKEEGLEVWDEIQNAEELSDFTLELVVSGGAPVDCGGGGDVRLS